MGRKRMFMMGMLLFTAVFLVHSLGAGETQKPKIAPPCKQCYAPDEKILREALGGVPGKAGTIQVQIVAYLILKEAGYKVRFLNADIKIDKDGKYEISKE